MEKLESFIAAHFDDALAKGHIIPYYQPVIRTISKKLCSFEALARWVDPERGVISPGQFIPVLENNHVIHQLDACIIRQVCATIRRTVEAGEIPIPVSVAVKHRMLFCLSKENCRLMPPCSVYLIAFETTFVRTWPISLGSP